MADNIKISSTAQTESQFTGDDFAREHSEKLQTMGRSLVSSLYMLVRSVKLYDPDNSIFNKPLESLRETINQFIAVDGKLELQVTKDAFYINAMLVRMDANSLDNVRYLQKEMKEKNVGGFQLIRAVSPQDLKNFLSIFSKEQKDEADEDGLKEKKLVGMKLVKFSAIKEKLKDVETDDEKVDRKKYAMTCYARCVFYLRQYIEKMKTGKTMGTGKAGRLIQDLVDISYEQRTHFLGMTSMKDEADYHIFHQVNVALMAIVFANELELDKTQMRDVGMIALFHETGMSNVPDHLLKKPGALTVEEKAKIQRGGVETVKQILAERNLSRQTLMRLVVTAEHKNEFGTAVKDSRGNIQMIIPKGHLSVYAKMISICCVYDALTSKRPFRDAYGPEIALTLMWTEMRHKFDPELLKVFMKVMAIQPIRVLPKNRRTVAIG